MKYSILFSVLALGAIHTHAQSKNEDVKSLPEATVISGSKYEEKQKNISQKIVVIDKKEIEQSNATQSGDLLERTGKVFVQKSQLGGSSPVLRGFEASRVLLVVDGVRMNNAIYRAGHLQNVITLDPNMLSSVEVLMGPSSTLFGSDALGGVMNFRTKDPVFASKSKSILAKGNAFARYATAASAYTAHADVSLAGTKFGSLTSITYSNFGDLVAGANRADKWGKLGLRNYYVERINGVDSMVANSNPQKQISSAYNQYDILEKLVYRQSNKVTHRLNLQYSNSSNVPRYDRLTDMSGSSLKFAEWYYGPQTRLLAAYELQLQNLRGFFNEARLNANYQNIDESRYNRRYKSANLVANIENVKVIGYDLSARHKGDKNELIIGTDAQLNDVTSTATSTNITTNIVSPAATRYADGGSKLNMFALYAQDIYKLDNNWVFNAGLRYSINQVTTNYLNKVVILPYTQAEQNNAALTGNIGIIYNEKDTRFAAGISTGFRNPNVDDLTKFFESTSGGYVVVPNKDLKPEKTTNFDISLSQNFSNKFSTELGVYYTLMNNAIVLQPSTFNGSDSIVYGGTLTQVQSMQNAAKGNIFGTWIAARYAFTNALSLCMGMYCAQC